MSFFCGAAELSPVAGERKEMGIPKLLLFQICTGEKLAELSLSINIYQSVETPNIQYNVTTPGKVKGLHKHKL